MCVIYLNCIGQPIKKIYVPVFWKILLSYILALCSLFSDYFSGFVCKKMRLGPEWVGDESCGDARLDASSNKLTGLATRLNLKEWINAYAIPLFCKIILQRFAALLNRPADLLIRFV